ncbi:unnamed protein product [Ixodes pacificus]
MPCCKTSASHPRGHTRHCTDVVFVSGATKRCAIYIGAAAKPEVNLVADLKRGHLCPTVGGQCTGIDLRFFVTIRKKKSLRGSKHRALWALYPVYRGSGPPSFQDCSLQQPHPTSVRYSNKSSKEVSSVHKPLSEVRELRFFPRLCGYRLFPHD